MQLPLVLLLAALNLIAITCKHRSPSASDTKSIHHYNQMSTLSQLSGYQIDCAWISDDLCKKGLDKLASIKKQNWDAIKNKDHPLRTIFITDLFDYFAGDDFVKLDYQSPPEDMLKYIKYALALKEEESPQEEVDQNAQDFFNSATLMDQLQKEWNIKVGCAWISHDVCLKGLNKLIAYKKLVPPALHELNEITISKFTEFRPHDGILYIDHNMDPNMLVEFLKSLQPL